MHKKQPGAAKRPQPPRLANALLELCFNTYEVEEIQGDLIELFDRRVAESGPAAARRQYWGTCSGSCCRSRAKEE